MGAPIGCQLGIGEDSHPNNQIGDNRRGHIQINQGIVLITYGLGSRIYAQWDLCGAFGTKCSIYDSKTLNDLGQLFLVRGYRLFWKSQSVGSGT